MPVKGDRIPAVIFDQRLTVTQLNVPVVIGRHIHQCCQLATRHLTPHTPLARCTPAQSTLHTACASCSTRHMQYGARAQRTCAGMHARNPGSARTRREHTARMHMAHARAPHPAHTHSTRTHGHTSMGTHAGWQARVRIHARMHAACMHARTHTRTCLRRNCLGNR